MQDFTVSLYPISKFKGDHLDSHLEYIRIVRNQSSKYMTRFRGEITSEMQKKWYSTLSDNINLYIFMMSEHGVIFYPCGYGIILDENGTSLLTGVVEEKFRGKGLGRELFSNLIEIAKNKRNKVALEVDEKNIIGKNLYDSLGFVTINKTNNIIYMELSDDSFI